MHTVSGGQVTEPEPNGETQDGLFIAQVLGPESEEQFIAGFSGTIRSAFIEQGISVTAAHNFDSYYIYGEHATDPASIIDAALQKLQWKPDKVIFLRAFKVGPPGGNEEICSMPYNKHGLKQGEKHQKCDGGHLISLKHNVARCPRCGLALR